MVSCVTGAGPPCSIVVDIFPEIPAGSVEDWVMRLSSVVVIAAVMIFCGGS